MKRVFELQSDQFQRVSQDDELVNAETIHGHALASFLATRLRERGWADGAFVAEDWGWLCPVESDARCRSGSAAPARTVAS